MKKYTRIFSLIVASGLASGSNIGEAANTIDFGLTGNVAATCSVTRGGSPQVGSFDFGASIIQASGSQTGHFSAASTGSMQVATVNCNGAGTTLSLKTTNGALKTGSAVDCTAATCANYKATAQLSGGNSTVLTANGTPAATSTAALLGAASGTITMTVDLKGSTGVPAAPGNYSDTITIITTPSA